MTDIAVVITRYERDLILEYGYPFDEILIQLNKTGKFPVKKNIKASSFIWEQLVGNLSISINEGKVKKILEAQQVCELAEKIEFHLD